MTTPTDKSSQEDEKVLSAEEIAELNNILWPIDTDEGIQWWVEDISDDQLEKIGTILFWDEETATK